ncbi:MAG: O-acetylhomoserine aminocarboxypropyltransferase/cysteine synthase [Candidatus Ancillula sp.]|jgi:OAH/OAS sulfhydrylase|nr:O-acetylhomoserine aminocarboxypropyltransferase/cysteine synthase [Candidatus Ancillula sp.]
MVDVQDKQFETKCVRGGYDPGVGEPVVPPITPSVAYRYETTEQVHELFDLEREGYFYSRIENPTTSVVEKRVAMLDGGVGALMTSSGQAANLFAILNIASNGDHIVAARNLYGGTVNLFTHRLKEYGISTTFIDNSSDYDAVVAAIKPNTKAVFTETLSNPTLSMTDLEVWAKAAHDNDVLFVVDNTFPTPFFCRPIDFGADVVTYSSTKYLDGHALEVSGMIVDSGKFGFENAYRNSGRYSSLVEPDQTYKGVSYTKKFGEAAYIVKARVQLMRDLGATPSPFSAFLLGNGLQTLGLRMERHYSNAQAVAKFLENNPQVEHVNFPALDTDPNNALAKKYLPKGCAGVLSFVVKGGRESAGRVINAFKLVNIEVNVAEIRSCALHPATSTHRQMSDTELKDAGIEPGLIRLSVGLENIDDILEDVKRALEE